MVGFQSWSNLGSVVCATPAKWLLRLGEIADVRLSECENCEIFKPASLSLSTRVSPHAPLLSLSKILMGKRPRHICTSIDIITTRP